MALKEYQERVLSEVETFLRALAQEEGEFAPSLAWMKSGANLSLLPNYNRRMGGNGRDIPNFCLKVPTGGGKTLLATQVLGTIYDTILRDRNGAGLALWIVPSDQIYKDTLKALRDRSHFYRESLEFAVKRPIEVWEKHEIMRLTPAQLAGKLNILLLILSSANREDRETLKMFRDSGGNIVLHFPPEDDEEAHRELRRRWPNLEIIEGTNLVKTSVGNLLRMHEPPVIMDEGHRAYSDLAQRTLNGFNPSIIVELSATPHRNSNVLCKVSGKELLREEMIKLPINVAAANLSDWRDCLNRAVQRRDELEKLAADLYPKTERFIRPIVLVQVERTGRDQRGGQFIHSEDVREHLIERCGLPVTQIAVKSSSTDDIKGIDDLMDEDCPVRYIITKSALQEGWDCPFAYILVSLNNAQSTQSMTQLVGRILRQPYQERTETDALNESYVYCLHKTAARISGEVKRGLEQEGYEGDAMSLAVAQPDQPASRPRTVSFRGEFQQRYKDFEGKIYLPRFCVKRDDGKYEPLNYYDHLLNAVHVEDFSYDLIEWRPEADFEQAKESLYRIELEREMTTVDERLADLGETEDSVRGWLLCNLGFDDFSQKQLRTIVERALQVISGRTPGLGDMLPLVKTTLRDRIRSFTETSRDKRTEAEFKRLFDEGRIGFFMACVQCRFQIPPSVEIKAVQALVHGNNDQIRKSLFDYVEGTTLNEYERSVALYLDGHPEILWWYRNLVGANCFNVQGYKPSPIYPDFVAATQGEPYHKMVCVIESKGSQLMGNADTDYKEDVASYFDRLGRQVSWAELGQEFQGQVFRFQVIDQGKYPHEWQARLRALIQGREVALGGQTVPAASEGGA
ncbi:MAG: DEAD/DEAH box helicase family protein [Armatimonadota bacterium]|nr:DEAD/DEAH box helicase family protein [Armatimonadota bacterium]